MGTRTPWLGMGGGGWGVGGCQQNPRDPPVFISTAMGLQANTTCLTSTSELGDRTQLLMLVQQPLYWLASQSQMLCRESDFLFYDFLFYGQKQVDSEAFGLMLSDLGKT